ncbi:MAG: NADH-quinone oxidoreductase subunit L [Desulfurococcales archaeon]|nr:NADH-quinone oxidoreductase subunit L [Desulfurococcales archaeon]
MEASVAVTGLIPWSLIWMFPYLGALILALLYLAGVKNEKIYGWGSVLSIAVSAIIATMAAQKFYAEGPIYSLSTTTWVPWLNITLGTYLDGLGVIMSLVVSWLSLLIAIYSVKYMEGDWGVQRYFFFFTFFVASMLLLVTADNLVLMFIGWEGTGLASYALIGHWYTDEEEYWVGVPGRKALGQPMYFEPSHSGVRAILFTRIGDIGLLIGMAVLFLLTGTFNIPELAASASSWMGYLATKGILVPVLVTFSLGALAKSAQFPFHEWLVTAMTGPTPVSALIHAATMVKAGVYFMLRFVPIFFAGAYALLGANPAAVEAAKEYFLLMAGLGAVTAFMMATMALVSNELKLILAYSTASQLGYMFLGAAAAGLLLDKGYEGLALGISAGLSHLVSHAVFKAALFLIAGWLIHVAHSRFIDPMGKYAKYMKITAIAIWLAGLSLMGIPPLSGFFSKELVLKTAEEAGFGWGYTLGVVTAALTAAYTFRMVLRVFHLEPYEKHEGHEPHEAPGLMLWPYTILAVTSLILGLYWTGTGGAIAKAIGETLSVEESIQLSLHITTGVLTVLSLVFASIIIVWALYVPLKVDFRRLIAEAGWARILHDFLYDRWYINSIYYIVIVGGFSALAYLLGVVDFGIDMLYHYAIPVLFILGASALRALHRGKTNYYMMLYVYFAALILLFVYLAWG